MPLAITCSTAVLPRRRTLPALVIGTTLVAIVSMPPMPVPSTAPVSQFTRSSSGAGTSSRASFQASTAAIDTYRCDRFIARNMSSSK